MAKTKNQEPEPETPQVYNLTIETLNITVENGGVLVIQGEPKENPPKPPGGGG